MQDYCSHLLCAMDDALAVKDAFFVTESLLNSVKCLPNAQSSQIDIEVSLFFLCRVPKICHSLLQEVACFMH